MNPRFLRTCLAIALSGLLAANATAGFDEGFAAYEAGDFAGAMREFQPLANQGEAASQFALGVMYEHGQGVPQDHAQAVNWYRKAAEQGHAAAQNNLGVMYGNGRGVPQDYAQAVNWYRKAAEQGLANAQNNLGVLYANGQGVDRNYAWAVYWQAKAARQGNHLAPGNIEKNLPNLRSKTVVSKAGTGLYGEPAAKSKALKKLAKGTTVYITDNGDQWDEVYLPDGHLLGWVRNKDLKAPTPKKVADRGGDIFPRRPAAKPGYVTCNTRCFNGDCYRTYSNGKQVRFQAPMKWNPFNNQMEYDSGGC